MYKRSIGTLVLLAAFAATMQTALRAERVGAAAAVKPSSTGTPPGAAAQTLQVGTDIVTNERIQTTGSGSLQVMFLDKSTLTIGPNSEVVIDEFVYRPDANGGSFTASMTKGALRFVGGQISHNSGVTVQTPVATIGLRGGAAFITHDAVCQAKQTGAGAQCTKVVCTGGVCTVNSKIDSRSLQLRINQAVEIGALGASQPFSVTSVTLNDVSRGRDGAIVKAVGNKTTATFTGQGTISQTIAEQSPEPPPPAPP